MVFDITDKVALITGAASGIGLQHAKELLRNGVRGVTLTDCDAETGTKALDEIINEFGNDKAIFIKMDVTDIKQFEDAFKKTIEKFKNIDILINNAGIMNDAVWEKQLAINVNGTIHGLLLGLGKYLSKYKQGEEAVILNTSSICGIKAFGFIPIYCASKFAVTGLTYSWGDQGNYDRTKVRVVGVSPGPTDTQLLLLKGRLLGPEYDAALRSLVVGGKLGPRQGADFLAQQCLRIIKFAKNGSIHVVESGEPAYEFVHPDYHDFKKNVLKEE